jgi:hypothetical protein
MVRRPFVADGQLLGVDRVVDAGLWPNLKLLMEQGYLAPVPAQPAVPSGPSVPSAPPPPRPPARTTRKRS